MGHFREPIKNTCPDIDKLIKGITEIERLTRNIHKIEEVDDLKDIISSIETILYDFEVKLEMLRDSNDKLRCWGSDEAHEVDILNDQIERLTIELDQVNNNK